VQLGDIFQDCVVAPHRRPSPSVSLDLRRAGAGVAALLIVFGIASAALAADPVPTTPQPVASAPGTPGDLIGTDRPADEAAAPVEQILEVRRGDTLIALLVKAGVSVVEAFQAIAALQDVFAPKALMPGQEIKLSLESPEPPENEDETPRLVGFSLQPSVEQDVTVTRGIDGGFIAAAIDRPLSIEVARAASRIESSLFEAGRAANLPLPVLTEVIRAFSYDVDFQRELQPGDRYEVVYERYLDQQGGLAKAGAVLYAALTLSGKTLEIYRFAPSDGPVDFFTPAGDSVRKALLRTPIDGARISSGYGMRKHPILGYSKMHRGVDFAASSGTPILAAGDGVIARIGRNGAYGNYIQIRHRGDYATAYAHLSRFAKGLRKGSRIGQGDIIGYVGSTGRSTGPHLHYEVLRAGAQINPRDLKLPSGTKLAGGDLKAFRAARAEIDRLRDDLGGGYLMVRAGCVPGRLPHVC